MILVYKGVFTGGGGVRTLRIVGLILVTLGLLAGGFAVYWLVQPDEVPGLVGPLERGQSPSSAPVFEDGGLPLGAGKGVWVKSYSDEGELTSEFNASRYVPQKDGSVVVEQPQARFYLRNGQYLLLEGKSGLVVSDQALASERSTMTKTSARAVTPSRGELHDVTLSLFDSPEVAAPSLVANLNNAAFDNQTFRIYTEQYQENGQTIARDQVPVRVIGDEFEFYGRGLTIRWDEMHRRLDMLEVAHGEKLIVRNPGRLGEPAGLRGQGADDTKGSSGDGAEASTAGQGAAVPDEAGKTGGAAQQTAASAQAAAPGSATQEAAEQGYHAQFMGGVRIEQNGQTLALADTMALDLSMHATSKSMFSSGSLTRSPATGSSATKPGSGQATAHEPVATATPAMMVGPDERVEGHKAARPEGDIEPDQPVTVYWQGPLRMTPLEQGAPAAGTSVLTMEGSPLSLNQQIGQIVGRSLRYDSATGRIVVSGDEDQPVVLHDEQGTKILTQSLEYRAEDQVVILRGKGQATLPVAQVDANANKNADQKKQVDQGGQVAQIQWDKSCELKLVRSNDGQLVIDRAQLAGNVVIDHPQMDVQAQALDLQFAHSQAHEKPAEDSSSDAASTGAMEHEGVNESMVALERVSARGQVKASFAGASGQQQEISADALDLVFAADAKGRSYPSVVHAQGQVRAHTADQSFSAGSLEIAFDPAPPPQPEAAKKSGTHDAGKDELFDQTGIVIRTLTAQGQVRIKTPDTMVDADRADYLLVGGSRKVTLTGKPMATLQTADARLTGRVVELEPDIQHARVVGAGSLHAMQKSADGSARPVDVAWEEGAEFNGESNQGVIRGNVAIRSQDVAGQQQSVSGQRVILTFANGQGPVAPANQTDQTKQAGQADRTGRTDDLDLLRGKQIQSVMVQGDVELALHDVNNGQQVERGLSLQTQRLDYEVADGTLTIPQAGRMLYEDHRVVAQAAREDEQAAAKADLSQMRGLMAVAWGRALTYNPQTMRVTLNDKVHIVYEPEKSPADRVDLRADQVELELENQGNRPAEVADEADEALPASANVRSVRCTGNVYFKSRQVEFHAASLEMDPQRHLLIARGSADQPAELLESTGAGMGRFGELWLDTRTQQILKLTNVQGQVR